MCLVLHIHDKGDPSVGIWPQGWHVQAPFEKDMDNENKEFFRQSIKKLYEEFAEGKLEVVYDYELKYQEDEF